VQLTEEGGAHPVTSECKDLNTIKFEGLNPLGGLLENSTTLIRTQDGRSLLGVRECRKGRTAALATDALWFYGFAGVGMGQGNRSYQEFVRRMVRWLVKDPAVGSVGFSGIRGDYAEGSSISFFVKYDGNPVGKAMAVNLVNGKGKTMASKQIVLGKKKSYPVDFKNPGRGLYIVRAEVLKNRVVQDYAAESFEVGSAGEYGDPAAGEALLDALAQETKGVVIPFDEKDLVKRIQVTEKTVKRILEKKSTPLWNTYAAVILVCLAFGLEWFLRKRKGLL
ncbi:MAG: hypothetical protein V1913_09475, partial [Fibrobacterota bacterium]